MTQNASDVLTPPKKSTPENIATIRESLGEIAQVERARLQDSLTQGKDRAREVRVRFEDYVREKPIRSLAYAAGVGAVIGLLLNRRR